MYARQSEAARPSSATLTMGRSSPSTLDGISLLLPAGQALVENLVVAPSELVEDVAGSPSQRVRARSVENDRPVLRHFFGALAHASQGERTGTLDVKSPELGRRA